MRGTQWNTDTILIRITPACEPGRPSGLEAPLPIGAVASGRDRVGLQVRPDQPIRDSKA